MSDATAAVASAWQEAGGWRLHARVGGEPGRAPIVCVHGVVVSSRYFVPTVRELAVDHLVAAVDLPGFGLSDHPPVALGIAELSDALAAYLKACGCGPATVLANSFGCQVAVDCAVRHPAAVSALVLVGPTGDPCGGGRVRQVLRWLRNSCGESPRQFPLIVRDYRDAGLRRARATFRSMLADRVERKLGLVAAPTLVVRGRRDRIVTQEWAEEVVRLLVRGRLVVVPDAAHTVNFTHPGDLGRVVRDFLAEAVA